MYQCEYVFGRSRRRKGVLREEQRVEGMEGKQDAAR